MRILVIEDERKVASFLKKGLEENAYAVDVAPNGKIGEELALANPYDLILLDVMLPVQDGWETLRRLRQKRISTPVLMLTALGETEDKIRGLDYGADDYLTKPFEFGELLARVRALLRRRGESRSPVLRLADLELDPATHEVTRAGKRISLTAKEFALLEYLLRNRGIVLSRDAISEHVWNMDFNPESNVVDAFVKLLRKKIDKGFDKQLIHTVVGIGYVMREPDDDENS